MLYGGVPDWSAPSKAQCEDRAKTESACYPVKTKTSREVSRVEQRVMGVYMYVSFVWMVQKHFGMGRY